MKTVAIYTDGACSGNPGVGGWAAVMIFGDHKKEISGNQEETTNNQMELRAAIESLKALKEPCAVELHSDSAYLVNAFNNSWVEDWQTKGWKNANKKQVKNIELWKELIELAKIHQITWIKVKGHSDNEMNNRCDELATDEIENFKKEKSNE